VKTLLSACMSGVISTLALLGIGPVATGQEAKDLAAPARSCEVRQAAWCISQGAWEITDRFIKHDKYDHAWFIRGFRQPKSPLVVLEPSGCRAGFSDSLSAMRFDRDFAWDGRTWNRLIARLRNDGSCDLEVLIPKPEADPSAEAFFSSLILLRNCPSETCDGKSFNALAAQWDAEYRRKGKPAN
jgi:hypothetical protein